MSPILAEMGGVRIYYYGLAYAFGFVSVNVWVLFLRRYYEWSLEEAYDFSICFTLGVLLCGRACAIVNYFVPSGGPNGRLKRRISSLPE